MDQKFNPLGYSDPGPGPGVSGPSPSSGWERYKFVVQNHFWKLIKVNLLFVLFSLPVFTLPGSMAGMTSVLMCLVRDGNTLMWQDFWREFKADFPRRIIVFFFLAFFPSGAAYLLRRAGASTAASALSSLLSAFIYVIESYWYPMIVKLDISVWNALRNAALLVPIEWKSSLVLFGIGLLFGAFSVWLYPWSLPILLLGAFSFAQLASCVIGNDAINRRILPKGKADGAGDGEKV